ncbi:MAG: Hsp20/alpha crystallin family protein [Planctomycetota bacterium]|jgi:HSP20 family protein
MEQCDAWQEMRKHLSDMAETIDGALRKVPPFRTFARPERPAVNLYELPEEFVVQAEVPGVGKDELSVSQRGRHLVIEGAEDRTRYQDCRCLLDERGPAEFSRELLLPEGADLEAEPAAAVEDGLLTVRIKRSAPQQGKAIRVQTGSEAP